MTSKIFAANYSRLKKTFILRRVASSYVELRRNHYGEIIPSSSSLAKFYCAELIFRQSQVRQNYYVQNNYGEFIHAQIDSIQALEYVRCSENLHFKNALKL